MSFWKKIKKMVPLRHVVFILCLFAVTIAIHYFDSAEDVKVNFGDTAIDITCSPYSMNIPYDMIESLELVDIPDRGSVINGADNMVKRYGSWHNDAWGEYCICADLDCTNCIVAHLSDGQIFVFSRKSNAETISIYEQLLTYIEN